MEHRDLSNPTKVCPVCGQPITDKRRTYCSDACRDVSRREMQRQRHINHEKTPPFRWITCPDCGKDVYVSIKSKRCASCQRVANRKAELECKRRIAAGKARKLGEMYPCEKCGKLYTLESGVQQYCKNCAPSATKANIAENQRKNHQKRYGTEEGKQKRKQQRSGKPAPIAKTCAVCGKEFLAAQNRIKCCSDDCKKKYMQAYHKQYDAARREEKSAAQMERYRSYSPEQRAEINRRARERYAQHKNDHD